MGSCLEYWTHSRFNTRPPRERIAKRLGQARVTIHNHLAKMPELANQPNSDLSSHVGWALPTKSMIYGGTYPLKQRHVKLHSLKRRRHLLFLHGDYMSKEAHSLCWILQKYPEPGHKGNSNLPAIQDRGTGIATRTHTRILFCLSHFTLRRPNDKSLPGW